MLFGVQGLVQMFYHNVSYLNKITQSIARIIYIKYYLSGLDSIKFSASNAAIQPEPAAVIAWRYT